MIEVHTLVCEKCNRTYVSADADSMYCGLCRLAMRREAAQERLDNINARLDVVVLPEDAA